MNYTHSEYKGYIKAILAAYPEKATAMKDIFELSKEGLPGSSFRIFQILRTEHRKLIPNMPYGAFTAASLAEQVIDMKDPKLVDLSITCTIDVLRQHVVEKS